MNSQIEFLDKNDCQLLLVDVQQSLLNACVDAREIEKRISVLIDFARIMELPIILTEQNSTKLGKFLPELVRKAGNSPVLNKIEFGCFGNNSVDVAVAESGRKTILLAGIETHVCIFQTGVQGLQKGYRVQIAADAVSASSRLNHEIGLRRLAAAGAVISSVEMIIFELLERAGSSQFHQALPIIKSLNLASNLNLF